MSFKMQFLDMTFAKFISSFRQIEEWKIIDRAVVILQSFVKEGIMNKVFLMLYLENKF